MIRIIDYSAGNAPSVLSAVGYLGYKGAIAQSPHELDDATHIILPGVGTAGATMRSLNEAGFSGALERLVLGEKRLFLGVCVGMQILFQRSQEDDAQCLGWLAGEAVRFDDNAVKVPQIGWNNVDFVKNTNALQKERGGYFYFVNSYYVRPHDESIIWATAEYGGVFTAAINSGNIYATQFHVEKSGDAGLRLLDSFLKCKGDGLTCLPKD